MRKKSQTKSEKRKERPAEKHPSGWFLMAGEDISVREIKAVFPADSDIEIWPEAGVLEIVLGEKASMDIEETELPKDPESLSWFEERGISRVCYISFRDEIYDRAYPVMQKIASALNVTICADTDDLTPVVKCAEDE